MFLDMIILVFLIAGFIIGVRRGLVVQVMHLFSFVIALVVALVYYKSLAQKFVFWIPYPGFTENLTATLHLDKLDVDRTFYQVLAFALIFFIVKFALQIITSIFDFITYLPVLKSVNRVFGGVFGFIEFYVLLFIALYVLALVPLEQIQTLLDKSLFTGLILEHTPVVTSMFQNWWYIYTDN